MSFIFNGIEREREQKRQRDSFWIESWNNATLPSIKWPSTFQVFTSNYKSCEYSQFTFLLHGMPYKLWAKCSKQRTFARERSWFFFSLFWMGGKNKPYLAQNFLCRWWQREKSYVCWSHNTRARKKNIFFLFVMNYGDSAPVPHKIL